MNATPSWPAHYALTGDAVRAELARPAGARRMRSLKDEVGNEIKVGDVVTVTARDAGRGALAGMFLGRFPVLGFTRTRIKIPYNPDQQQPYRTVGPELVKVVTAVDGRELRKWKDARP